MALTSEKTRRKLYIICLKLIKKTLKIHKRFGKVANVLIVKMQTKKTSLKKLVYFKNILDFDLPKCFYKQDLQFTNNLLIKYYLYI